MNQRGLRDGLHTWRQGLGLSFWWRPRSLVRPATFTVALVAMTLSLAVFTVADRYLATAPIVFWPESLLTHAGYFLCVLIVAAFAGQGVGRAAVWLRLAALWLVADIPWTTAWQGLSNSTTEGVADAIWWRVVIGLALWLVLVRSLGFVAAHTRGSRRWAVATIAFALLALPWGQRQQAFLWGDASADADTPAAIVEAPQAEADTEQAPRPIGVDPDALIAAQAGLLAKASSALSAQTPGRTDLYAIGFAGDAEEAVFRNEVDYLGQLLAIRFGAKDRVLRLENSRDTLATVPIASLTNLRQGLKDVASRMDTQEDVLLLFLTSHGSPDHQLYVDLGDLRMHQIDPDNLRAALDDSGIRWRVVVVSACFSGGFIRKLSDPHTLVITAARPDRTSFGCGNDSEITWFGKAYLTEALNQTTDFREAFKIARKQIGAWEHAADYLASVPQIREGALIGTKLDALQATLPAASTVPFVPTVPSMQPADATPPGH